MKYSIMKKWFNDDNFRTLTLKRIAIDFEFWMIIYFNIAGMYPTVPVILGADLLRPEAVPASPSWVPQFWSKSSATCCRRVYSTPPNWCWPEAAPAEWASSSTSTASATSCGRKERRRKCAEWPIPAGFWITSRTLRPTARIPSAVRLPRPSS